MAQRVNFTRMEVDSSWIEVHSCEIEVGSFPIEVNSCWLEVKLAGRGDESSSLEVDSPTSNDDSAILEVSDEPAARRCNIAPRRALIMRCVTRMAGEQHANPLESWSRLDSSEMCLAQAGGLKISRTRRTLQQQGLPFDAMTQTSFLTFVLLTFLLRVTMRWSIWLLLGSKILVVFCLIVQLSEAELSPRRLVIEMDGARWAFMLR